MKTLLKIVAVISGLISMISAIWLACLYMDDILKGFAVVKGKIAKLISRNR